MTNTHLGEISMIKTEYLELLSTKQYGSRKSKEAEIQALNTRLFYNLIRQGKTPETSIFTDLVSNYDLVVHSIASLSLQRVDAPKEPIL